ncbi:hypothetical protein [Arthrobacter luteolus]|uniref:hypothetical protein n=1 Tax=Arthrobacter luteolus TaxID=98672 RepID=UPI00082A033A|nr:hypothetical protein [Arthrobacter luteolus]
MNTVESLIESKQGQRQLRLLEVLAETMDSGHRADTQAMEDDPGRWDFSEESLKSDLRAMKTWGWLIFEENHGGIGSVDIYQPGLDAVSAYKDLKSNPIRKMLHLRDVVLAWLYGQGALDVHVSAISDFLESGHNQYLGSPYSHKDVMRAADWLLQEEYIEGFKIFGGEIARPKPTPKGMRIVESEESVNQTPRVAGNTHNNINIQDSNSVNVAFQSSRVQQSSVLSQSQVQQVERALSSVRAMLNPDVLGVTSEDAAEARSIAEKADLEVHAETPDRGKVKALLGKLAELAATGTVQGAVDALISILQQAIGSM